MMSKGLRLVDVQALRQEIRHVKDAAADQLRKSLDEAEQQAHHRGARVAEVRAHPEVVRSALRGLYQPEGVTKHYPHEVRTRRAGVAVARICTCGRPLGGHCIRTARETGQVVE